MFGFVYPMTDSISLEDLPILRKVDNATSRVCLGDDLRLVVMEGQSTSMPEYFQTSVYALNLLVRGSVKAHINHQLYEIAAPSFSSILINQILNVVETSEDMVQYVLSYSPQFAEDLHLSFSGDAHVRAYMRPVLPMTEQQMRVVLHYIDLLCEVIQTPDVSNAREVALNLVRSMVYFVYGLYDNSFSKLYKLSRSEELAGRFLALVEMHCHEHHSIDWYAKEMCLTPQYIANVVKQVTGRSTGECINYNLVRQAKVLLLTTSLSVQQISDRLGFQNQSHFGTFFRRSVGMSPRAFRERK
jgi:AraC-like DNA-binding protein